jgi:prevent-host-death family protein
VVTMVSVGIRELKTHLSEYVATAAAVESVVITLRGREVAIMTPLDPDRATVNALVAAGKARWGGGKPSGVQEGTPLVGHPASDAVLEDRR